MLVWTPDQCALTPTPSIKANKVIGGDTFAECTHTIYIYFILFYFFLNKHLMSSNKFNVYDSHASL